MSKARFCFSMCDNVNQSNVLSDHLQSINTITYNLTLSLIHFGVCLYFLMPFLFRYSLTLRRHILFSHSVGLNLLLRRNYFDPKTHGLQGGRNFYLKSPKQQHIKLGVWHILPKSLLGKSLDSLSYDYWNETLRSSGKPIIVYFHGAIGTRATGFRIELYNLLQEQDYHVIAFDYRGFGDSTQVLPSETGAVEDGLIVFNWLRDVLGPGSNVPIFVWGHSLGTGVSNHLMTLLASDSEGSPVSPIGLILEAPFTNMKEEVRVYFIVYVYFVWPCALFDWFFVDPLDSTDMSFENDRHIQNIKIPILMLHATNDLIVPYRLGRKLYNIAWNSRSKEAKPIHFTTFKGFGPHTSHSYICRSPRLPGVLKIFKNSCMRVGKTGDANMNELK